MKQFIEIATGIDGIAGHGLKSYTNEISVIKFSIPEIFDPDILIHLVSTTPTNPMSISSK